MRFLIVIRCQNGINRFFEIETQNSEIIKDLINIDGHYIGRSSEEIENKIHDIFYIKDSSIMELITPIKPKNFDLIISTGAL